MAYLKRISSLKNCKRNCKDIAKLIKTGDSLQKIGETVKLSRERVRQLLHKNNLYDSWKEYRKENEIRKKKQNEGKGELYFQLHNVLLSVKDKKVRDLSWPEQKAIEYRFNSGRIDPRISYQDLVKIYSFYEKSVNNGKKAPLSKFEEKTGVLFTTIASILKKSNLGTLSRPRNVKRYTLDYKTKNLVEKCKDAKMPCNDLAYFIGLGSRPYLVSQKTKGNKPRARRLTARFKVLSYRKAFEVYEALDLGFKRKEISELLDLDEGALKYIFQNRTTITDKIKDDLKTLYSKNIPEKYKFLF